MPSFQITWHLCYRNNPHVVRAHVSQLQHDINVVEVVAVENPIEPARIDIDVTLLPNFRQPRQRSLQDLHVRYPAPGGANIEERIIPDPEFPPEPEHPFVTEFMKVANKVLHPKPRPKPREEKTVYDHLLEDDDDPPV